MSNVFKGTADKPSFRYIDLVPEMPVASRECLVGPHHRHGEGDEFAAVYTARQASVLVFSRPNHVQKAPLWNQWNELRRVLRLRSPCEPGEPEVSGV